MKAMLNIVATKQNLGLLYRSIAATASLMLTGRFVTSIFESRKNDKSAFPQHQYLSTSPTIHRILEDIQHTLKCENQNVSMSSLTDFVDRIVFYEYQMERGIPIHLSANYAIAVFMEKAQQIIKSIVGLTFRTDNTRDTITKLCEELSSNISDIAYNVHQEINSQQHH